MSKSQKRRERRQALSKLTPMDNVARIEQNAIDKLNYIGPVRQKQLNKFYTCDGFKFGTGKTHHKIG